MENDTDAVIGLSADALRAPRARFGDGHTMTSPGGFDGRQTCKNIR